jgi:hypothetical protein
LTASDLKIPTAESITADPQVAEKFKHDYQAWKASLRRSEESSPFPFIAGTIGEALSILLITTWAPLIDEDPDHDL